MNALPQAHRPRVAVVVLGDLGRSPRMQYHALSLADAGADVELIGAAGHEPFAPLRDHPRVRIRRLGASPPLPERGFVLRGTWRTLRQAGALLTALLRDGRPDVIVAQNPPALPTLAVVRLAARLCRARLVIDWHNLGFAMLGLRLGSTHAAVRAAAWYEGALGRRADAHLCVSHALSQALAARWNLEAAVLHDRPARIFVPLDRDRRAAARSALGSRLGLPPQARRLLVVSPTSWTADEDFPLLLQALQQCTAQLPASDELPRLLILLTGDGPLRTAYESALPHGDGAAVQARALWLPADEYPTALAAADLGLSLHRSASGLDLPMKIADMFGAGLPVCSLDYAPCLREIVRPGENALLFATAGELATLLCDFTRGGTEQAALLARLRAAAAASPRWDETWPVHAAPTILGPHHTSGGR